MNCHCETSQNNALKMVIADDRAVMLAEVVLQKEYTPSRLSLVTFVNCKIKQIVQEIVVATSCQIKPQIYTLMNYDKKKTPIYNIDLYS